MALNNNYIVVGSNQIYYSSNNGNNWSSTNTVRNVSSVYYFNNYFFASTIDSGIYRSSNNGANWIKINTGIDKGAYGINIKSITSNNKGIFCGSGTYNGISGVYYSSNSGNNWEIIGFPTQSIFSMLARDNFILSATYNGIFITTNNGDSWIPSSNGLSVGKISSIASNDSTIFVGRDDFSSGGVFKSTNNGLSWIYNALSSIQIVAVAVNGSNVFAGSFTDLYKSTNNGINWSQTSYNWGVNSILINGNTIFVASTVYPNYRGVYISNDNGNTWSQTELNNKYVYCFAKTGNNIFAGTQDSGVYLSTNNGTNWTQTSLNNKSVYSLAISGNNIFAGISNYPSGGGVYLSTNNGATWLEKNQGFDVVPYIDAFLITSNYIFAGTGGSSVWRRSLSEVIGIQNISTEIPSRFSLSQNYPNPFNPTTNIKFDISNRSFVKLIIYNSLGKEVAKLVNEEINAGSYQVDWNACDFPNGVYFYKLQTEGFAETKRMVLLK